MSIKARKLLASFAVVALLTTLVWGKAVDGHHVPIVVTPADSTLSEGDSTSVTVELDGAPTTNQVVNLSSSSSLVDVPTTVTVLAGHTTAAFVASSPIRNRAMGKAPEITTVHVTASCNGGSATGDIDVN